MQRKGKKFEWTKECAASFEKLKNLLTNSPSLKNLDHDKEFIVFIHVYKKGIGRVLMQEG